MEYLSASHRRNFDARVLKFAEDFHKRKGTVVEMKAHDADDLLSQAPPAEGFNLRHEIEKELARWLSEPSQQIRSRVGEKWVYSDPAEYWRFSAPRFPLLAPLAQQVQTR